MINKKVCSMGCERKISLCLTNRAEVKKLVPGRVFGNQSKDAPQDCRPGASLVLSALESSR